MINHDKSTNFNNRYVLFRPAPRIHLHDPGPQQERFEKRSMLDGKAMRVWSVTARSTGVLMGMMGFRWV